MSESNTMAAFDDDWSRYLSLSAASCTPQEVCRIARQDKLDAIATIRMLRNVLALNLGQAKEVALQADGWSSLNAYQESLVPVVEALLREQAEQAAQRTRPT